MSEVARQALARDLARRLLDLHCSLDELRVIGAVLARLELGRHRYGPLRLAVDRRDWRSERREELLDAMIYQVAGELADIDRERDAQHESTRAELVNEWSPDRETVASRVPEAIAVALGDIADSDSAPYLAIKVEAPSVRGKR